MARTKQTGRSLDATDQLILDTLAYQARLSNAALAKIVGLSESATLERVRRLEKNKVIRGYCTRIDPAALGQNLHAIVTIRLKTHTNHEYDDFLEGIRHLDRVISCYKVMGAVDFVAHIATEDVEALEQFLTREILSLPAVERTESMLVLQTIRQYCEPPDEE